MAVDKNGKKLPKGITQRPDGRYMGRFTYQGERFTLYNTTVKALEKAMNDMRYELEHGLYGDNDKMTVGKWFKVWINEYKKEKVKESTLLGYQKQYDLHAKQRLGKMKLRDIKTLHIQKIYNDMLANGMTVGSVKNLNIVLSNLFKLAVNNEYIIKNPCTGIVWPAEQKKERRVLTQEEQVLFLEFAKGSEYENLYIVALLTGLRVGELTALTWSDIDFSAQTLEVNKTLVYLKDSQKGKCLFKNQTPKTKNSTRVIPLLPEAVKALKRQRLQQNTNRMRLGDKWVPEVGFENLIFTTHFGAPVQKTFVRKRIHCVVNKINRKRKEDEAAFREFSPHTLRHTFATRAFESGVEAKVVQELLGHGSIKMTMDLYTHVTEDKKVTEIQKMQDIVKYS